MSYKASSASGLLYIFRTPFIILNYTYFINISLQLHHMLRL